MASTVLFVVVDPERAEQPPLERAANLLQQGRGHIHAFCAVHRDDYFDFSSSDDSRHEMEEAARRKVEERVRPLVREQLSCEVEIGWSDNPAEAAVQACARTGADLLLTTHQGSLKADHYLLRHSPCPVLLTGHLRAEHGYRRVLAALALEDNDRKHDRLNNHVIAQAQKICRQTGAELFGVTAVEGSPNITQLLKISENDDAEKRSDEELLSERFGIDADKVRVDYGPARAVIQETAKSIDADLVVIGTVARRGITGAITGNTCEKVIEEISLDVLAVT